MFANQSLGRFRLMVTVLRSIQRRHVQRGLQEFWHSFAARDQPAALADGFGILVAFDEMRIPTGDTAELHSVDEDERVTYVHKGALSQEDTTGKSEVIHAGEFQRLLNTLLPDEEGFLQEGAEEVDEMAGKVGKPENESASEESGGIPTVGDIEA